MRLSAPWINGTHKTLLDAGWDHSSWTRRRIVHVSDSKAHVDTEFTRYRKDGAVIASFESLCIVTRKPFGSRQLSGRATLRTEVKP